jgi:hypothetical protein
MVGDFHALGRFGELVFADADGNIAPPVATSTNNRKLPAAAKGGDVHAKK